MLMWKSGLVQSFLEKGEYRTADACKQEGDLRKPDGTVEVWRKQGRQKPVLYHALEGCPAKTDATWRRVVAVFVQGKKWQFKGWPFKVQSAPEGPCPFGMVLIQPSCGLFHSKLPGGYLVPNVSTEMAVMQTLMPQDVFLAALEELCLSHSDWANLVVRFDQVWSPFVPAQ